MSEPLATLAQRFERAPYNARLGLRLEAIEPDRVRVRIPYKEENSDPGKALPALIDTVGAMASWSIVGLKLRHKASTVGMHVTDHAPVTREDVAAVGGTRRRNDEIFLNEGPVTGWQSGAVIATGPVTYRIVVTEDIDGVVVVAGRRSC